ncbi:5-hydroxytryptamine receptor 3A-like isoform X2 [Simochromis diagramma]|uniref:5-hydroxytryptamine receptor 3A-like isoform X2 n=1 Tax=Simochromis diagramma TaxID=43689 RepID=UPI001A7E1D08|nr:5-hydroxytryptamine receptor 3A-like isoform X2 [Simochromis diagramma]
MAGVKAAELIVICFMVLQGFVAALNCTSPTPAALFDELTKHLFPNKLLRPVETFAKPINISISITVAGIIGVDEKSQTLSSVIWQVLEWDIEGLNWDEKECAAKRVSVPRDNLWVPDIHLKQLLDEASSTKTPYVYLYNTGHVYDDKPITVVTSCQLGIYTFPFDIQNCSLTFGSYIHFATDIQMIQGATAEKVLKESRDVIVTNGEWELTDINIADSSLHLDSGSYSEITYYIVLKRRPIAYVVNLLVPSCFLITVDLFSFVLPPQSVDRSSFKMTLILGYTVFLLIMNDLLPVTGEKTPLITPSANTSATNLSDHQSISDVTLSASLDSPEPVLEQLRMLGRELTAIRVQMDKYCQGTKATQEWEMIGTVIDRLLFGLYIIFIFVSFITIISIWIWNNSFAT